MLDRPLNSVHLLLFYSAHIPDDPLNITIIPWYWNSLIWSHVPNDILPHSILLLKTTALYWWSPESFCHPNTFQLLLSEWGKVDGEWIEMFA